MGKDNSFEVEELNLTLIATEEVTLILISQERVMAKDRVNLSANLQRRDYFLEHCKKTRMDIIDSVNSVFRVK